jgi:hypothetical protein
LDAAAQAGAWIDAQFAGKVQAASSAVTGSEKTRAQLITCQPPSRRDSFAPSA